jgi:hypothetical protein
MRPSLLVDVYADVADATTIHVHGNGALEEGVSLEKLFLPGVA